MKLRVHYLDENGRPATHDYSVPQSELRRHVDGVAERVANKGMLTYWNGSDYLFTIPASRVLLIEKAP